MLLDRPFADEAGSPVDEERIEAESVDFGSERGTGVWPQTSFESSTGGSEQSADTVIYKGTEQ
jgi:hypothetical protein